MKALTVKQPWAELIVSGAKDIENRTWRTNYRGRVLIHAAKIPVSSEELSAYPLPALHRELRNYSLKGSTFSVGSIIGSVEIVDCVRNHPSEWAEKGVWNWVLAKPHKYEKPILNVNGKLSLWDYNFPKDCDFPYGMFEHLMSIGEVSKDIDEQTMRDIEMLDKEDFLNRLLSIAKEYPFFVSVIENDIQYFRDSSGETIAQIWASPTKNFTLSNSEIEKFKEKLYSIEK